MIRRISTTVFEPSQSKSISTHLNTRGWVCVKVMDEDVALRYASTLKKRVCDELGRQGASLMDVQKGMVQFGSAAHEPEYWEIRLLCEPAFKAIYGDVSLVSSMDAITIFNSNRRFADTWLHVDQASKDVRCVTVQGCVVLTDDDCTVVADRSIHAFPYAPPGEDPVWPRAWYKYANQEGVRQAFDIVQPIVPAGTLFLWDSRTIHQGTLPSGERRVVTYVCMAPRTQATEAQLKRRRKQFEDRRTTRHNPIISTVFSKTYNPRTLREQGRPPLEYISQPLDSDLLSKINHLI